MRKVIESTLISVDGVIGDPHTWTGEHFDQEATARTLEQFLGRAYTGSTIMGTICATPYARTAAEECTGFVGRSGVDSVVCVGWHHGGVSSPVSCFQPG